MNDSIELCGFELYAAARLLGLARLLLPRDPFRGQLVKKIELELEKATEQLLEKGWLEREAMGLRLNERLAICVGTLAAPFRSLVLMKTDSENYQEMLYMHRSGGPWVRLDPQDGEAYRLQILKDEKAAGRAAVSFLDLTQKKSARSGAILLGPELVQDARKIAAENGAVPCEKYLREAGVENRAAGRLAQALAAPESSGSVVALAWQGQSSRQTDSLAFLEGADWLWLFEDADGSEQYVKAYPSSARNASRRVLRAIGSTAQE